jgi:hypothetical protein
VATFNELLEDAGQAFKAWVLDGYEPGGGSFAIEDATDVDLTGRADGDALVFNGVGYEHVSTVALSSVVVVVNHGADPDVARPSGVGAVYWNGSVEPANWVSPDLWNDTSEV